MKFPWKRVIKKKKQQAPYLCEKQPYRFGTILYTTFHIPSTVSIIISLFYSGRSSRKVKGIGAHHLLLVEPRLRAGPSHWEWELFSSWCRGWECCLWNPKNLGLTHNLLTMTLGKLYSKPIFPKMEIMKKPLSKVCGKVFIIYNIDLCLTPSPDPEMVQ